LGLAAIKIDRGQVVQLEETEVLEHGIGSGAKGAKGGGLSAPRRRLQARPEGPVLEGTVLKSKAT
jgi:hypothetical protein